MINKSIKHHQKQIQLFQSGLQQQKSSLEVKNGYASVGYQQAESAHKVVESSGVIKVGVYKVYMLADAVKEQPFYETIPLAVQEEPELLLFCTNTPAKTQKLLNLLFIC